MYIYILFFKIDAYHKMLKGGYHGKILKNTGTESLTRGGGGKAQSKNCSVFLSQLRLIKIEN